jgi:hypothetical protein
MKNKEKKEEELIKKFEEKKSDSGPGIKKEISDDDTH